MKPRFYLEKSCRGASEEASVREALKTFSGVISEQAKWADIPAHSDPDLADALDKQAKPIDARTKLLRADLHEALRRSYAEAGYQLVVGSFESGGAITTITEVLLYEANGEAYSWDGALPKVVPAASTPYTTGGVTNGAWRPVGDITLRGDLAASDGATLVGFQQSGPGAVQRTSQDKMRESISVLDFGAIGNGTLYPVSDWYTIGAAHYRGYTSLAAVQVDYPHVTVATQSIDWVACQAAANASNGLVYAPEGVYFLNELLELPDGVSIVGDGCDHWDVKASWRPRKMDKGTTLLFGGAPTKFKQVPNVSNMRVAGGVIANDAPEGFAGNQYYSLLDFTNGDSVSNVPATPKNLKVGVCLGNDSMLIECRVQLNYFGVDGYNSVEMLPDFPEYTTSYKGLGDNWDIGVLTYNKMDTGLQGVQVVGYWRMAARAIIASNYGDGRYYSGCVFHDDDIFYQGFYGLSIRSNDVHRITAIDDTTVTVPWNASHTVPLSGQVWLSSKPYDYTSTSKVGDKIVLSGFTVNPSSLTTVGKECFFGTNPGFAISSVSNGTMTGMNHFTNRRCYDTALEAPTANPGGCFEISGSPLRHIEFNNVHLFDVDVVGFLKDAMHIAFTGCDAEAQGFEGMVGSAKGARLIASAPIDDANAHGTYPAGATGGLTWDATGSMGDGSVDLKPVYSSELGRHPGTAKYFMPDTMFFNPQGYWVSPLETRRRYNVGTQVMTKGPAGSEYFEVVDPNFVRLMRIVASNGRVGFGGITSPTAGIHYSHATQSDLRLQVTDAGFEPTVYLQNSLGSWDIRPALASKLYFRYATAIKFQIDCNTGSLNAGVHNAGDIGSAANSYRIGFFATSIGTNTAKVPNGYFNNLFTDSGSVGVSDETLKTDIQGIPDEVLDAWGEVKYYEYRHKDMVDAKGGAARTHFGVMAQRIEAVFKSAGIDPFKYGILCIETWEAEYAPVMAWRDVVIEDVEGEGDDARIVTRIEQEEYETGETRLLYDAGSRYGVRYMQALVLEAEYQRRRCDRIEARLTAAGL